MLDTLCKWNRLSSIGSRLKKGLLLYINLSNITCTHSSTLIQCIMNMALAWPFVSANLMQYRFRARSVDCISGFPIKQRC